MKQTEVTQMKLTCNLEIEDFDTKQISEHKTFENLEDAQKYVLDVNGAGMFIIRSADVFENDKYIGRISQNGRFWPAGHKYAR